MDNVMFLWRSSRGTNCFDKVEWDSDVWKKIPPKRKLLHDRGCKRIDKVFNCLQKMHFNKERKKTAVD